MWCPVCKEEYSDKIKVCKDCGCALTDKKPETVTIRGRDINNLSYLTSCITDFEADVVISLLKSCNIYGIKRYNKYSQIAKVFTNSTNLGVDIYVSDDDFKEAKDILSAKIIDDNGGEFDEKG